MRGLLLIALCAAPAAAEPDFFGRGDGHSGPLNVAAARTIVNAAVPLRSAVAIGSTKLEIGNAAFVPGDLILIVVSSDPGSWPATGALDPTGTPLGSWELARVTALTATGVQLSAPLEKAFAPPGVQVVRVPEYSQATIADGGSVVAAAWDGGAGGVVALFVDGPLVVRGQVSAAGAGHRGGVYRLSPNLSACAVPDSPFPQGAARGEGVVLASYEAKLSGSNRATTGGGGGLCNDSGGGGGGHGAVGGTGGASFDGSRDVGGRGGAQLLASFPDRLTFGGGGGAGWGNNNAGTNGGNGGGIVWIRAAALSGQGTIEANGAAAKSALSAPDDGLGGGGAGGSVLVEISGTASCGLLEASGGDGGNAFNGSVGPGGGGAGGRARLVAAGVGGCTVSTIAGVAGIAPGVFLPPSRGAHPTAGERAMYEGVSAIVDAGFAPPAPPMIVDPIEGAIIPGALEVVVSAPGASAVLLRLDGAPVRLAGGDGGIFATRFDGGLSAGPHVLIAQGEAPAWRSADGPARTFVVPGLDAGVGDGGTGDGDGGTLPVEPRVLRVGCGCASAEGPALLLLLVAFALRIPRVRSAK